MNKREVLCNGERCKNLENDLSQARNELLKMKKENDEEMIRLQKSFRLIRYNIKIAPKVKSEISILELILQKWDETQTKPIQRLFQYT